MLISTWHILTKRETYRHYEEEDLAYKLLIWAWVMDDSSRKGMTLQQFTKYGLLRLGTRQDLERIVRGGAPRRIAPTEEILTLKPELGPLR